MKKGRAITEQLAEPPFGPTNRATTTRWHLNLFGRLQLVRDGEAITNFRTRKAGVLLAYLALHPNGPHGREFLVELLWPESDVRAGRANLRFVLTSLRQRLEPADGDRDSILVADNSWIGLRPSAITTDVSEFSAALYAAEATEGDERIRWLARAVDLHCNDLLPGMYDPWAADEREALKEQYRNALSQLARLWRQKGDIHQALRYARNAVSVDGLREESHVDLIRLYMASGDPGSALRQYRKMEAILTREMKRSPSSTAQALLPLIRKARTPGVTPSDNAPISDLHSRVEAVSTASFRNASLPTPLTWSVERTERAQVIETIQERRGRLVTLTGPVGVGKTRLALDVAHHLTEAFGGRALFVPAAEFDVPSSWGHTLLSTITRQRTDKTDPWEEIAALLGRQPTLLVIDSPERLAEDGARVIGQLLERVPTLACLVASCVSLGLLGEHIILVPPFPLPEPDEAPEQLQHNACVRLLTNRIQAVHPDFALTTANASVVAQLCRRLDGLPFAIELAALWARTLTLSEINERLSAPLTLLAHENAALPERHRSFEAALRWSYHRLPLDLQHFFARLSVLAPGFSTVDVEQILEEPQAMGYLRRLQEHSLVFARESGGRTCFRLLEITRAFASRLLSDAERSLLEARYAALYGNLRREPDLLPSRQSSYHR